jgi:PIF1-like helicase
MQHFSLRLSLQSTFRGRRFLIIDEKSMIPLKTLAMMDQRLRQIFPEKQDEFFGGINVFLCGDFFQLPSVVKHFILASDQVMLSQ